MKPGTYTHKEYCDRAVHEARLAYLDGLATETQVGIAELEMDVAHDLYWGSEAKTAEMAIPQIADLQYAHTLRTLGQDIDERYDAKLGETLHVPQGSYHAK
jgi:hypothetical protein